MSSLDVSGSWDGLFRYPGGKGPETPFLAKIQESAGFLTGDTIEPDLVAGTGGHLHAVIAGHRDGTAIDFTKTYDGKSRLSHSIAYAGRLSEDGTTITGVWSLAHLNGTFEMVRDLAAEEPTEAEAEAVVEDLVE